MLTPSKSETYPQGVFLSYSRKDELVIREIYHELRLRGVASIWMDRKNLIPGDDWETQIRKAIIEDCSHVVVCISPDALRSEEVKKEYELAIKHDKRVIPLILHTCGYEDLPPLLRQKDALSIPRDGQPQTILSLIKVLPLKKFILPEFVHIPQGTFTMGHGHTKTQVDLPEFWIGKNSITVTEYACFLRWYDFQSDKFWLAGTYHKWQTQHQRHYWNDLNLEEFMKKHPKQPMRGMTWYEGIAYCRWLSYVSGHHFTLPSEAQWEKSARGTDERKWAFGNEWITDGADIKGTDNIILPHPKDIGIIRSESPYGCQNMIGNVWNWTLSIEFEPPYRLDGSIESLSITDLDEPRVIKGGSWRQSANKATTYHREGQYPIPNNYKTEIGIRLVTFSPPSW